MKILLAVDGSKKSLDAVTHLVRHSRWYRSKPSVELVTVHLPVPRLPNMSMVVGKGQIERYYREEGEARLARAKRKLAAAKISYRAQILVGAIAESILAHAARSRCDLILIGSRGMSAAAQAVLGSTANKVLQRSRLPVLVVT